MTQLTQCTTLPLAVALGGTGSTTGVSLTSAVSGVLPVANGGTAIAVTPPVFCATRITSAVTVTTGTPTKVQLNSVRLDSGGWWNPSTFLYLPLLAGTYLVSASVYAITSINFTSTVVTICKNGTTGSGGVEVSETNNQNTVTSQLGLVCASSLVAMNGTTDTLELDITLAGSGTLQYASVRSTTQMSIMWVGP